MTMISMVQPLAAGNALRLFVQPPAGAVRWRIVRKATDDFADQNEDEVTGAFLAYEGNERAVVDTAFLRNEAPVFYRPFYRDALGEWTAGPTASGTPAATYVDLSTDALSVVRERLEAGLKVEVERGNIASVAGYVHCYTAPPLAEGGIDFPVVTMHVQSEEPAERAIGEYIGGDSFEAEPGDWSDTEGWLASVSLQLVAWSLNADERQVLRQAIRRVILANLPVFSAAGMEQVALQQSDMDFLNGEFNTPQMYQSFNTFTCLAPIRVGGRVRAVRDVEVSATSS